MQYLVIKSWDISFRHSLYFPILYYR